jgi:glutaredoxin
MKYYGDAICAPCRETKTLLDKYGIPIEFINVEGMPEYENRTPILELDDGMLLEGKEAILDWFGIWS